jgi:hypothetical protein
MNKPADAWLLRKDLEIQFGMSALAKSRRRLASVSIEKKLIPVALPPG